MSIIQLFLLFKYKNNFQQKLEYLPSYHAQSILSPLHILYSISSHLPGPRSAKHSSSLPPSPILCATVAPANHMLQTSHLLARHLLAPLAKLRAPRWFIVQSAHPANHGAGNSAAGARFGKVPGKVCKETGLGGWVGEVREMVEGANGRVQMVHV